MNLLFPGLKIHIPSYACVGPPTFMSICLTRVVANHVSNHRIVYSAETRLNFRLGILIHILNNYFQPLHLIYGTFHSLWEGSRPTDLPVIISTRECVWEECVCHAASPNNFTIIIHFSSQHGCQIDNQRGRKPFVLWSIPSLYGLWIIVMNEYDCSFVINYYSKKLNGVGWNV